MSALHGEGVAAWLKLLQQRIPVGQKIAEVDCDTYAEGEAVLGWLNATASLSSSQPIDWGAWSLRLLAALQLNLERKSAEIAHMKMLLVSASNQLLSANLSSSQGKPAIHGRIFGDSPLTLVFNARAQISPEELHAVIVEHLKALCGETIELQITAIQSLSPGRPQPVHRYAAVV